MQTSTQPSTSTDSAHVWQLASLSDLTLIHGRYRTQRFPRHVHEEYVIGVNEAGAHRFYCRGDTHPVPAGSIALLNPGDVHTGEPLGNHTWNYRGFYPSELLIRTLWAEATGHPTDHAPVFLRPVVTDHELAQGLIGASRAVAEGRDGLEASCLLVECLTTVLLRHSSARSLPSTPANGGRTALLAREYIQEHALGPISLRDLADAAESGRFAVLRAFRRAFGITPYEYVMAVRVGHARRLLAAGSAVAATAIACGFTDQSHLHRFFRRIVGVTPGAFARAAGKRPAGSRRLSGAGAMQSP